MYGGIRIGEISWARTPATCAVALVTFSFTVLNYHTTKNLVACSWKPGIKVCICANRTSTDGGYIDIFDPSPHGIRLYLHTTFERRHRTGGK